MSETGPDRIRAAIKRDRGGDAPQRRIRVCGPDCRGEVPAGVVLPHTEATPRGVLRDRLLEPLICGGCIRFRFSPVHLFYRAIGICDGKNLW